MSVQINHIWSTILAGATGALLTLGVNALMQKNTTKLPEISQSNARQVNISGGAVAPFDFTRAAEKSMASVVHIKTSESREAAIQRQRQYYNPFRNFFGDFFEDYTQPRSGTGSGVIYTNDGYIITNNHVVEFGDIFTVTLHDKREFNARLVGKDPNTDMAVLKIDGETFPALDLGNSDDVKVGEWALAVGNPFDLTSTVTAGIISAKGRDINIIQSGASIESFIQTDAAVNPGNSGGALVDTEGRLIGINTAIATPTGVFAGYSFAIPVNLVKRIADDLIKYGEYRRPDFGAFIATMDTEVAQELEIPYVQGVAVVELVPNGSAEQAGIQPKDVITQINGKTVTSIPELREFIGRSKVGESMQVTLVRNGKEKQVPVRLKTRNNKQ